MQHTVAISFDTDQKALAIALSSAAFVPSLSGEYLRVHLPRATSPAKTIARIGPTDVPVEVELLYDQPDKRALVEATLTAGASTYDVALQAQLGQAPGEAVTGKTGSAIVAALSW